MTLPNRQMERPFRRRALTVVLTALFALSVLAPAIPPANAQPASSAQPLFSPAEGVRVDAGPLSLPSDGAFRMRVGVDINEPTSYLEVRLQIHRPSGRLIFQRTEVHSNVDTGTVEVEFARELSDLDLRPDAYPYTVRVRTQATEVTERTASGFLLVHAPRPEVTPVVVGARISTAPRFDAQGNFVTDPARSTAAIEAAEALSRAVLDDRALKFALAISPVTLDEWGRIAHGYTLAEADAGLVEVAADEPGPIRYAAALKTLQEAIATGRLVLLDVGYGDPDPVALDGIGSVQDIAAHYTRGLSAYLATLETTPSTGTAVAYDALPIGALDVLAERGHTSVMLAPESLGDGKTSSGGAFRIEGATVTGLVLDRDVCDALEGDDPSAAAFLLFRHAVSDRAKTPVITLTDLGPGRRGTAQDLLRFADFIRDAKWAEFALPSDISPDSSVAPLSLTGSLESTPVAPAGYWEEATNAQRYALALQSATGAADPDARSVVDAALIAQSARWAGP
ncbi:MAG: hypothetical protein RBS78_06155, partial [Coriobacteriia bacterium]|nr:hypothetical protein [Coriobacteriia bacterium]